MTTQSDISGTVQSILFGPAEDGFTLISILDGNGTRHVASGREALSSVNVGDELQLEGKWDQTDRGVIFRTYQARRSLPSTPAGLVRWLSKAKIPGIGERRAEKLVERFGTAAVSAVVAQEPDAVAIITKARIEKASDALAQKQHEAEIGSMLAAHEIGPRMQRKIFEEFGDRTHDVLTKNPYSLITRLEGVAFTTADKIAKSAGVANEAPARIRAGIIETLREAAKDGHCALHNAKLLETCRQRLYVDEKLIEAELDALQPRQIVQTEVKGQRAWALSRFHSLEQELARHVVRKVRDTSVPDYGRPAVEKAVSEACSNLNLSLNAAQKAGAIMALTNRISILTGGPGTGKTRTLQIICEAWRILAPQISASVPEQRQFALSAPTGKAAKRIHESTGYEGKTLHRLLEYLPEYGGFQRNTGNPLRFGLIAVDESSMLDVQIATDLARAWGSGRVLLIGDTDQLPSVGPGRVLGDLLDSEVVPHVRLTEIWRQAKGSDIALAADAIKQGKVPAGKAPGQSDFVFIDMPKIEDIPPRIEKMFAEDLPRWLDREGIEQDIQILTPGRKSLVGTHDLNARIQAVMREKRGCLGPYVQVAENGEAGVGDRVIQLDNDYERGIFNGDTGVVTSVVALDKGSHRAVVDFGSTQHSFEGKTLSNLALSSALTIHKMQGSECQVVIIPVTTAHWNMMRRTLLYTGITRAKRLCILIGSRRALEKAVRTADGATRVTTLAGAIRKETAGHTFPESQKCAA